MPLYDHAGQRPTVALPGMAVGNLGSVLSRARLAEFSPEQVSQIRTQIHDVPSGESTTHSA